MKLPPVTVLQGNTSRNSVLETITKNQEDAFFLMDISDLVRKHKQWTRNLPNVTPFYAVKCNDSIMIIKTLANLGCGFDCASMNEIKLVINEGVSPDRIIYANPCKTKEHIKFAAENGVQMMTFDNFAEIDKIKECHRSAKMVVRIRADAKSANVPLGAKYGCNPKKAIDLMLAAHSKGLEVYGISFHVGSGCNETGAYARAINIATEVILEAKQNGINLKLLDIGGGFPGNKESEFIENCRFIKEVFEEQKINLEGMRFIAEPGRFFATTSMTLVANVIGKKCSDNITEYYINDGIYSSLNIVVTENFVPKIIAMKPRQGTLKRAKIWGPTMEFVDKISDSCLLPEQEVGDWLLLEEMGAYSTVLYSRFYGYIRPQVFCIVNEEDYTKLRDMDIPLVTVVNEVTTRQKIITNIAEVQNEMKKVLSAGVSPDRIIFANPCKMESHIKYAAENGIELMTFDNFAEIDKMKNLHKSGKAVLRIRADAKDANYILGSKFGCDQKIALDLILAANKKGVNVHGISFHVGSGCNEAAAFARAVRDATQIIIGARKHGIYLTLIDIGGGFHGNMDSKFNENCRLINEAIEDLKDDLKGIRFIGEPGQFYVTTCMTLVLNIIGKKVVDNIIEYVVNDGIFSTLNIVIFENFIPDLIPLKPREGPLIESTFWGQTLEVNDKICDSYLLPEQEVGDWLLVKAIGAYSRVLYCPFYGFEKPKIFCIIDEKDYEYDRLFKNKQLFKMLQTQPSNLPTRLH